MQYTYSTQHTIYSTRHTLHSIRYSLYSCIQYTVQSAHSIQLYSTQYTLYNINSLHYTVYSIQYSYSCIQDTIHSKSALPSGGVARVCSFVGPSDGPGPSLCLRARVVENMQVCWLGAHGFAGSTVVSAPRSPSSGFAPPIRIEPT